MENELPLADVTALFSSQRAGGRSGYSVTFQVGHGTADRRRADQKQMDDFLRGSNGAKLIRLTLRELPSDWAPAEVDPDQGEAEIATLEDRLITLWNEKLKTLDAP